MVSVRYYFIPVCLEVFFDVLFSGGCAEDEGKKLCLEDKRRLRLAIHLSSNITSVLLRITKSQPLLKNVQNFSFCLLSPLVSSLPLQTMISLIPPAMKYILFTSQKVFLNIEIKTLSFQTNQVCIVLQGD